MSQVSSMLMLTPRQLAVVLWTLIALTLLLARKGVRSPLTSVLKSLVAPKLLLLLGVIVGYNLVVVWALWRVGYWDWSMLYDTVVFIAVGEVGSAAKAASREATYDWRFLSRTVLVNLGWIIVLLFLIDFYSQGFWLEFLLIVPLISIVVLLALVSKDLKGAEHVHRLFNGVQIGIGLCLLVYVLLRAIVDYNNLLQAKVLFSLTFPAVMSVLYLPLLLLVCALFAYEDAFVVLSLKEDNDRRLMRWKQRRLILHFGLDLRALQAFRRSLAIHEFAWVKSKDEARTCLALQLGAR